MKRIASLTGWLLATWCATAWCQDDRDDKPDAAPYLTNKGQLRETLTIRDAQGGFAGFSGSLWTIEPDGSWQRAPFLNDDVHKPEQSGKLSAKQLADLAAALERHHLQDLPENIGGEPMANPHVFTLTFGKFASAMVLGAGADPPDVDDKEQTKETRRFAAIVRTVHGLMDEKKE